MLKWENELRKRPGGADNAEGGEGDVPHDEETAHLVPRPGAHVPLHEHDHGEVGRCNREETIDDIWPCRILHNRGNIIITYSASFSLNPYMT